MFVFRRAVKPVYGYGLQLDFGDRFSYLYSNNLTVEKWFSNFFYSSENLSALYIAKKNHNNHFRFIQIENGFSLLLKSILRPSTSEH